MSVARDEWDRVLIELLKSENAELRLAASRPRRGSKLGTREARFYGLLKKSRGSYIRCPIRIVQARQHTSLAANLRAWLATHQPKVALRSLTEDLKIGVSEAQVFADELRDGASRAGYYRLAVRA